MVLPGASGDEPNCTSAFVIASVRAVSSDAGTSDSDRPGVRTLCLETKHVTRRHT